jgi:hypothetical protein
MLKAFKKTVKEKEAPKHFVAYLMDRILINSRKPQIFGTQFHRNKKGDYVPYPIKYKKNLNKKRLQYQLPPFEEYKNLLIRKNKEFTRADS